MADDSLDRLLRYGKNAARALHASAPITSTQIGLGLGLYLTHTLGLVPVSTLNFYPTLVGPPHWQIYRCLSNFLVTGNSFLDVVQSSFSLAYIQGSLEPHLACASEQKVLKHRYRLLGILDARLSCIIRNRFLRAQVLSGAFLLVLELLLFKKLGYSSWMILPYSLFGHLDGSMKWLWSLLHHDQKVMVGSLNVHPLWIPLGLSFISGPHGWKSCIKGFLAALFVSETLNLRNARGDPIVDSALAEIARVFQKSVEVLRELWVRLQRA